MVEDTLRGQKRLLVLGCGLGWAVLLTLLLYTHARADDFSWWGRIERHGVLGSIIDRYTNWTGRWAGASVMAVLSASVNIERFYSLVLLPIQLVAGAAWIVLIKTLWGSTLSWRGAFAAGLVAHTVMLAGCPGLPDTMYWMTGAVYYTFADAMAMFVMAAAIQTVRRSELSDRALVPAFVGLGIASFILVAFNEVLGIYWILVTLATAALTIRRYARSRVLWIVMLSFSVAGYLAVLMAPGNSNRVARFEGAFDLRETVVLVLHQGAQVLPDFITDPRLICATLLLSLWPEKDLPTPSWAKEFRGRRLSVFVLAWIAGLTSGLVVPSAATGEPMPDRLLSVVYLWFILGWWILALATIRPAIQAHSHNARQFLQIFRLAAVLLILGLFTTGNVRLGLGDLISGNASHQASLRHSRFEMLRQAANRGEKHVEVMQIPQSSALIHDAWLRPEPDYWVNRGLAYYFGLEAVSISPPEEEREARAEAEKPSN